MKLGLKIALLTILHSSGVFSQDTDRNNGVVFDSLVDDINNKTVFIFNEYCLGCAKGVGDRMPAGSSNSCMYNNQYWMIWLEEKKDSMASNVGNNCFYFHSIVAKNMNLIENFNKLFDLAFNDSNRSEITIKKSVIDSNDFIPPGPKYYTVIKYESSEEYILHFNESLFLDKTYEPRTIEFLLIELLGEFEKQKILLEKKGVRNEINWKQTKQ